MTTETITDEVQRLHQKLIDCLNTVNLGVAGRLVFFDSERRMFILAMHTTSPDKTQEASGLAWESIPGDLRAELEVANIGFAGKQI